MSQPMVPVIVGISDIVNRSLLVSDAREPLSLIHSSVLASLADTSLSPAAIRTLHDNIDSIDLVSTWTWPYSDLPGLLAEKLGVAEGVKWKRYTEHGGNQPAKLVDEASRRVSKGETKVAIVGGGEALASVAACIAAKKMPPPGWTTPSQDVKAPLDLASAGKNLGTTHAIGLPIHVYPLYENGFRASRKQSIHDNNAESAKLYSAFAHVAEGNDMAWNKGQKRIDERSIGTVGGRNRMICFPYPLLMNAFNNVNMAASCIITSTAYAKELGIPEDKWIYPLGGAGTSDAQNFWERPNFHSSPAISQSLDQGLKASGLKKEDIDLYDFYSCFPIVPKLACTHLSIPILSPPKPITLLGGLTSFGGAGNNYSMHAINEMVRQLRTSKLSHRRRNGLILANGGVLSYQHVLCLSSSPSANNSSYPAQKPLPDLLPSVAPLIESLVEGPCVIETYTVDFNRDNSPKTGFVVGRMKSNNARFIANHGDEKTLRLLGEGKEEMIGKEGWVRNTGTGGRNLFAFEEGARL